MTAERPIPAPKEASLSVSETEVWQRANAGMLVCPCCEHSLRAEVVVETGIYRGVWLFCSDIGCGFAEF